MYGILAMFALTAAFALPFLAVVLRWMPLADAVLVTIALLLFAVLMGIWRVGDLLDKRFRNS